MNRAGVLLLCTCLAPPAGALNTTTVQSEGSQTRATDAPAHAKENTGRVEIEARSEFQFSEAEARQQAEARLRDELMRSITARMTCRIPPRELLDQLPGLAYSPEVRREESTETVDKPYGTMHRHSIQLRLESETLNRWVRDVVRQHEMRWRLRAGAAALTVFGWMLGVVIVVRLDRWTSGYHRPLILAGTALALACGTAIGWLVVLQ